MEGVVAGVERAILRGGRRVFEEHDGIVDSLQFVVVDKTLLDVVRMHLCSVPFHNLDLDLRWEINFGDRPKQSF